MRLRGYRRPSRRETALLDPIYQDVGRKLGLRDLPALLIADGLDDRGAWAHPRHIVISKERLREPVDRIGGLLAHELHHWSVGDATGGLFVAMCALPCVISANICSILFCVKAKRTFAIVVVCAAIVLWPFLVLARCAIAPLVGYESRRNEYDADAAAVEAGYGHGLLKMLESNQDLEPALTEWQAVLTKMHPPTEYRIEALQD